MLMQIACTEKTGLYRMGLKKYGAVGRIALPETHGDGIAGSGTGNVPREETAAGAGLPFGRETEIDKVRIGCAV